MNPKDYIIKQNLSPIDFPAINGLGTQSILTLTDPPKIVNGKLDLKITKTICLTEMDNNKEHEILKSQSVYEVPHNVIQSKEYIYNFYKDAALNLEQAYKHAQTKVPLPTLQFPTEPIENFQNDFDAIFHFLGSLN